MGTGLHLEGNFITLTPNVRLGFNCLLATNTMAIKGASAASFCHHVAALVPDMFCDIYLVKIHNIANNSETSEDREKTKCIFGTLRIF